MSKKPLRKGVTPIERPTEWTMAVGMLVTAFFSWQTDHNTAALVSVGAACAPAIITAIVSWWEARHADTVVIVEGVDEGE